MKTRNDANQLVKSQVQGAGIPVMRDVNNDNPKQIIAMVVRIGMHISVYFPESSDYFTGKGFVNVFSENLVHLFPHLVPEEIEFAIKEGMMQYKFHTYPRINDLVAMVQAYNTERLDVVEQEKQSKKNQDHKLSAKQIPKSVLDAYKSGLEEAFEEMREEEKKVQESKDSQLITNRNEAQKRVFHEKLKRKHDSSHL